MGNDSLITDGLRKLIGTTLETTVFKVEEGAIQRYAQAIGDPNPLYNDPDFASKTKYGRLLAPPGFTGWPAKAGWDMFKLVETLVRAGAPTTKVANVTERETSMGKTMFTTLETTFVNQKGNLALKSRATLIHL